MDKAYWQYWGKSLSALPPRQETYPDWHLLPYHCLDVAAVAASWWDNSQPLRQALVQACGIDAAQARAWMLLFMALHDYGKWDVRFQYKSKDTLQVIWPDFDPQWINPSLLDSKHYFHGPVGLSWFRDDYAQTRKWAETDQPERWEDGWLPWLAAVTGHHGVIPANAESGHYLNQRQAGTPIREHDRLARRHWVETLEKLFLQPAGLSLQDNPPDCPALLAGFCSVCDWLGSDAAPGGFEYLGEPSLPLS